MKSINPSKQRREIYNAPLHRRRKWIASHLEENLLLKYDKRAVPIVKGDTVIVMRGSFKGHEDNVVKVNAKKKIIEIEGITMSKADGNKIAKPIHPSNLLITKLNLTDKWRRRKLERGLSEETKKEIEKEAEEQIKEEEIKRKEEEGLAAEEKEEILEEEIEEGVEKPEKKEEKKTEEKPKKKPEVKKIKKPAEKKETVKKPVEKKKTTAKKETSVKKKPAKKTPLKTTKKKEKGGKIDE
jgi:large subunit ribosomal protein L24